MMVRYQRNNDDDKSVDDKSVGDKSVDDKSAPATDPHNDRNMFYFIFDDIRMLYITL